MKIGTEGDREAKKLSSAPLLVKLKMRSGKFLIQLTITAEEYSNAPDQII